MSIPATATQHQHENQATAALAWLACLAFVLIVVRQAGWQRDVRRAGLILFFGSLAWHTLFPLLAGLWLCYPSNLRD